MDVFLLIVTIVIAILLLYANIYWFILYSHPEEKGIAQKIGYKILIISAMTLCWAQILVLPLDVSNSRGTGGQMNMNIFWKIIYVLVFLYISVIIPAGIFLYEQDEEMSCKKRTCDLICKVGIFFVVIVLLLLLFWGTCKEVD
jgi:LMBR1 domain-containing protein 1